MADASTRPTVRMTDDEAWAMLERSITGILTTLRGDGRPVALPVWHVVLDRRIYVSTRGKKVLRAQNDPRCSYLVEDGERWADLRAVHVECAARVIEPEGELARRLESAVDEKYAAYRMAPSTMPASAKDAYRKAVGATIELTPQGRLVAWDNRKLLSKGTA